MNYSFTKASIWNITGYLYLIIASFISTRLLIKGLAVPEFASYVLYVAFVNIFAAIDLGLSQATIWRLTSVNFDLEGKRSIWSTSFFLMLSLSLVQLLITYIVTTLFMHTPKEISIALAIWVFLNSLIGFFVILPQAVGKFGWFNLRTFTIGTINTVGVGHLAVRGFSLISMIYLNVIGLLIINIIYWLFARSELSLTKYLFNPHEARKLLVYGLKNQLGKLVSQFQVQYGKFFLTTISPLAVASYSIARNLTTSLAGGVNQLATAFFPLVSASRARSKLKRTYLRVQLAIFLVGILGIGIFSVWGGGFIYWWLGDPLIASMVTQLLRVMVWHLLLLALTPMSVAVIDGRGKPEVTFVLALFSLLLEISFVLILLGQLEILAFAYGSLIGLALIFIPLQYSVFRSFARINK